MVLQINESPRATTKITTARKILARVPHVQMREAAKKIRAGMKIGFQFRKGMNQSKSGLLNFWLIKKNRLSSRACADCIEGALFAACGLPSKIAALAWVNHTTKGSRKINFRPSNIMILSRRQSVERA